MLYINIGECVGGNYFVRVVCLVEGGEKRIYLSDENPPPHEDNHPCIANNNDLKNLPTIRRHVAAIHLPHVVPQTDHRQTYLHTHGLI